MKKVLVLTSSFPKNINDNVPMFVYDQLNSIKKINNNIDFLVLAPSIYDHQIVDDTLLIQQVRFNYFFIRKFEKLAGNGILPAIKKNWFYSLLVPFLIFGQILSTIRLIKKYKPDLLYAHWFFPQAFTSYIIKKIYGVPYVFTTHALDAWILKKIPLIGRLVAKKIILNSSAYTSDSEKAESSLHSFLNFNEIDQKKSIVLPMPISFNLNLKISEKVLRILKNPDLIDNYILFIGRFASKKGVDKLIEIFNEVLIKFPNLKLILAGSGKEEKKYKLLIEQLNITNSIEFVGFVNSTEKKYLLDSSKISIIPSIVTKFGDEEGLPVVVLESLNSKTITLASYQSNAGEIIKNKINGFLFNPLDIYESSNLIIEILNLDIDSRRKIFHLANQTSNKFIHYNSSKVFNAHLFNDI